MLGLYIKLGVAPDEKQQKESLWIKSLGHSLLTHGVLLGDEHIKVTLLLWEQEGEAISTHFLVIHTHHLKQSARVS
jgi:hypothetical protein